MEAITNAELFDNYASILRELKLRKLVWTNNQPTGNYGEYLASKALGLNLRHKKGSDCTCDQGVRYEVKSVTNKSRQASALRDVDKKHFEFLVGIVFNLNHRVQCGFLIPYDVVKNIVSPNPHQRSSKLLLQDKLWDIKGVENITQKLLEAEKTIMHQTGEHL